jgi:hypothetical protein
METMYGLPTYVSPAPEGSTSKSTIFFICDAFGLELVNNVRLSYLFLALDWRHSQEEVLQDIESSLVLMSLLVDCPQTRSLLSVPILTIAETTFRPIRRGHWLPSSGALYHPWYSTICQHAELHGHNLQTSSLDGYPRTNLACRGRLRGHVSWYSLHNAVRTTNRRGALSQIRTSHQEGLAPWRQAWGCWFLLGGLRYHVFECTAIR